LLETLGENETKGTAAQPGVKVRMVGAGGAAGSSGSGANATSVVAPAGSAGLPSAFSDGSATRNDFITAAGNCSLPGNTETRSAPAIGTQAIGIPGPASTGGHKAASTPETGKAAWFGAGAKARAFVSTKTGIPAPGWPSIAANTPAKSGRSPSSKRGRNATPGEAKIVAADKAALADSDI